MPARQTQKSVQGLRRSLHLRAQQTQGKVRGLLRNKAAQDWHWRRRSLQCPAAISSSSWTDFHWHRRREQWPAASTSSTEVAGGREEGTISQQMPARQTQKSVQGLRWRLHLRAQQTQGQVRGLLRRLHLRAQPSEVRVHGMRRRLHLRARPSEEQVQGLPRSTTWKLGLVIATVSRGKHAHAHLVDSSESRTKEFSEASRGFGFCQNPGRFLTTGLA